MEYIHYGHDKFDKEKFEPIKNRREWIKPLGGLWASRVDAEFGWVNWCKDSGWEDKLEQYFKFKLKDNAKVLTITMSEQLKPLPRAKSEIMARLYTIIDFEELAKQYDAMEVIISNDQELHRQLYGWDCDSIVIMNPDVIEIIEE